MTISLPSGTTTLFPLQFKRQEAAPVDLDAVFSTTQDRTDYLTNPRRYAGQIVTDLEDEKAYFLNSSRDTWILIGSSSPTVIETAVSLTAEVAHVNAIIRFNNTTDLTYTVNSSHGFSTGDTTVLSRVGTGQVTIVASGQIINTPESLLIRKQFGKVTLTKVTAANSWDLEGNLTPV